MDVEDYRLLQLSGASLKKRLWHWCFLAIFGNFFQKYLSAYAEIYWSDKLSCSWVYPKIYSPNTALSSHGQSIVTLYEAHWYAIHSAVRKMSKSSKYAILHSEWIFQIQTFALWILYWVQKRGNMDQKKLLNRTLFMQYSPWYRHFPQYQG